MVTVMIMSFIILAIAAIVFCTLGILLLLDIRSDLKTADPQPVKTPSKPLFKAKSKPTDEEIKFQKLMTNIDNYTGSGKGQVKI